MQRNIPRENRVHSPFEAKSDSKGEDSTPSTAIEASTDIDSEVAEFLRFMEEDPEYFKECAAEFRRWGSGDPPAFLLNKKVQGRN